MGPILCMWMQVALTVWPNMTYTSLRMSPTVPYPLISSSKTFLSRLDAAPAALMQSWSLPNLLTQTGKPLHPHIGYCAALLQYEA